MSARVQVLLIEDIETDAKLVLRELRRGGPEIVFERVEDGPSMREALGRAEWDIILCDWSMPRFSAMAALALLRELQLDIPCIVVSGTVGEETSVDAMRAGARDLVVKDRLARLAPAVEREIREARERAAHRLAEGALRASEARYRRIFETTNEGVWVIDAHANTALMNARMAEMLGCDADAMVGKPIFDFLDAGMTELTRRHLDERSRGVASQAELQLRRPDGTHVWVLAESTPILDRSGRYEGAFAMMMDITARKHAEQALKESEARFAGLADSGVVGILVCDDDGTITDANDAFLDMVGYRRADLLAGDVNWRKLTPREHLDKSEASIREARRRGSVPAFEEEYVRKDGTRVPMLVGLAQLDASHWLVVMTDLTELKRAEGALRRSDEQLRQAQKMEAVGRLAGGIAHDFNNLLSIILSYGGLIQDTLQADDPMRQDLEEIIDAGRRAADLTRRLLMFSRQQVMEPRVLDLNEVLKSMDRMLRRVLGEDVELVSVAASSIGRIRADQSSIEQVIMNLAVNARDAMSTGGMLTVETTDVALDERQAAEHTGLKPGRHVVLAVTDNGVGMDPETQTRIFEPFFTTKEKGKGTGLGLSTVFGIVQQSGGAVWVDSEPGRGTTFKIYLPSTDGVVETARAVTIAPRPRGSEVILLVEDEDQVRAVARGILQKHGYHVIDAQNAGEALLHCEAHPGRIHLLLTDVVMPKMSGPELARRLAKIRPEMRILCMSGYTDDSIVRHGVLEARIAFLQKPFTPETLTRRVREVLDEPQVPTAPAG